MSDHVVLSVDHLIAAADAAVGLHGPFREGSLARSNASTNRREAFSAEGEAGNEKKLCRICHEEDDLENLEAPCSCNGTMKLVHRECIIRWIAEKLDTTCEICRQPYEGYAPRTPPPGLAMDASEEVDGDAMTAAAEFAANQIFGYDECVAAEGVRTAIIRASILIPIAFMMLKHAYDTVDTDDHSFINVVNVFCLHLVTVLAPLYLLSWSMDIWLRRRERLERARLREQFSRVAGQGFSGAAAPPTAGTDESPHVL